MEMEKSLSKAIWVTLIQKQNKKLVAYRSYTYKIHITEECDCHNCLKVKTFQFGKKKPMDTLHKNIISE